MSKHVQQAFNISINEAVNYQKNNNNKRAEYSVSIFTFILCLLIILTKRNVKRTEEHINDVPNACNAKMILHADDFISFYGDSDIQMLKDKTENEFYEIEERTKINKYH